MMTRWLFGALLFGAAPPVLPAASKIPILMWKTLVLKRSKKPAERKKAEQLGNGVYRIPGFMVPLEGGEPRMTKEFLLVPALPACIHVPPPPPEQTVHVKMDVGKSTKVMWEPIWVEGRVQARDSKNDIFGAASFEMQASSVRALKLEEMNEINKR